MLNTLLPNKLPTARSKGVLRLLGVTSHTPATSATVLSSSVGAGPSGPALSIICWVVMVAGVPGTMSDAMALCRPHGTMVLVGVCMEPEQVVNLFWQLSEVNLITTMGFSKAEIEMNRDLMVAGKIDPTPIITERIRLEDVPEAFERLSRPNTEIKILIEYPT